MGRVGFGGHGSGCRLGRLAGREAEHFYRSKAPSIQGPHAFDRTPPAPKPRPQPSRPPSIHTPQRDTLPWPLTSTSSASCHGGGNLSHEARLRAPADPGAPIFGSRSCAPPGPGPLLSVVWGWGCQVSRDPPGPPMWDGECVRAKRFGWMMGCCRSCLSLFVCPSPVADDEISLDFQSTASIRIPVQSLSTAHGARCGRAAQVTSQRPVEGPAGPARALLFSRHSSLLGRSRWRDDPPGSLGAFAIGGMPSRASAERGTLGGLNISPLSLLEAEDTARWARARACPRFCSGRPDSSPGWGSVIRVDWG